MKPAAKTVSAAVKPRVNADAVQGSVPRAAAVGLVIPETDEPFRAAVRTQQQTAAEYDAPVAVKFGEEYADEIRAAGARSYTGIPAENSGYSGFPAFQEP